MKLKLIDRRHLGKNNQSSTYLKKYIMQNGIPHVSRPQKITFTSNSTQVVHRWTPYIQGFSASFVDDTLRRNGITKDDTVLDCFAGCGTVNVSAKMLGIDSVGIELNPLMTFILNTKLDWSLNPSELREIYSNFDLRMKPTIQAPDFLLSDKQFRPDVLRNLLVLKENINDISDKKTKNILKLALASILIGCSNLKRSPSLGYAKNKNVSPDMPFILFSKKLSEIIEDLHYVRNLKNVGKAKVIEGNSKYTKIDEDSVDIAITSPPYANGIDYVINYKIEMGWLDIVKSQKDLRELKETMVACDNISRIGLREFAQGKNYSNPILNGVLKKIEVRMSEIDYRRKDMHFVIHKYFDDMHKVMVNTYNALSNKGKFVMVVGDSVIADVYVPTDIILANIGKEIGFGIDSIVVARERRSGKDRSRKLRETIVTLSKNN